ncbi:MAG: pirin family protein [Pseudomonadota bacterium]|nr:pirin family protein [Pseudomonadota bacterium]
MIIHREGASRGHEKAGWLDSRHTFSFGRYYDPAWMGFGPLRVINEDRVAPGAGFPPHRHANMEILSYVLSGGLAHRDSSGGGGVIRAGQLQWMSAGHGVEHSEFNASDTEPVHFLQVWLQPDRVNAPPAYAQVEPADAPDGNWVLLASPDGAAGSIAIRQDARLLRVRLEPAQRVAAALDPARSYWLHVARGEVESSGRTMVAGDAAGFRQESLELDLAAAAATGAELLLFDLPG